MTQSHSDADSFLANIDSTLKQLPFSQLMSLHHKVADLINLHRDFNALKAKAGFSVGEEVSFFHDGISHVGKIIKKNPKSISVHTTDHRTWKVSPHLLSKRSDVIDV